MVTNFEEITEELNEKELNLLPYVERAFKKFTSRQNAGKSHDICGMISFLYLSEEGINEDYTPINGARLRKFVNYFRKNGILPIIGTKEGYFVTNDRDEIEKQIKSLTERASGIITAANGLNKFL